MKAPDLGKMVGPLPLGAWVLVVGGGVGIAFYANRRSGSTAADGDVVDDASGAFSYYSDSQPIGPSGVLGAFDAADAIDVPSSPPPRPTTNTEWQRVIFSELVGRGFDPYAVNRALAAYLNGQRLTAQQQAIIQAALSTTYGLPPDPPGEAPPPRPNTPTQAQRVSTTIAECKAGNDVFAKLARLGVSVNDPRIVGTPCGRNYALYLLAHGGRPA